MNYKRFILLFVIGLTVSGQFAGVIYLPSLPAVTVYFHSTEASAKLILIFYLLGFGLSQLFFGPYSDNRGRKKALLIGLFFSFIGNIICVSTHSLSILNLARILVGVGSGAAASAGRAVLRDIFNDGKTLVGATSFIGMVTALTPAIGPAIGGAIQQFFDWRYNFLLLTIFSFLILLVCFALFKESNKNKLASFGLPSMIKGYGVVIRNQSFLIAVLCAAIAFTGLIAYEISAPFLFENIIGLTPFQFGLISLFVAGSVSIGAFFNKKLSSQFSSQRRLKFSALLFLVAASILLLTTLTLAVNVLSILLPVMVFATGVGIIFPTTIANALTPFSQYAGYASALFGFTQMILTMLINFGFTFIKINSAAPLAVIFLACGIIIFLLVFRTPSESKII